MGFLCELYYGSFSFFLSQTETFAISNCNLPVTLRPYGGAGQRVTNLKIYAILNL